MKKLKLIALNLLSQKRLTYILLGLVIVLHLGAFCYRATIGPAETPDSTEYMLCAQNAANGLGFQANVPGEPFQEELVSRRPMGYPILIYLLGQSKTATIAIQTVFSLATILLCFAFLKRETNSTQALNLALAGFLATPAQVIYSTSMMSEIPFQFFLTATFISIYMFFNTRISLWAICSAIALSIGFLIKPVLFPFAFLYLIIGATYVIRSKRFKLIPIPLIPVIVIFAIAYHNYVLTNTFEVSSIKSQNLLDVNAALVLNQAIGSEEASETIDSLETVAEQIKDYSLRQKFRQDQAISIFMKYPFITAYQYGKGMLLFLMDPGRFDLATYFGLDTNKGFMYTMASQDKNAIAAVFSTMPIGLWVLLFIVFAFNIAKIALFIYFLRSKAVAISLKIVLSTGILYIMAVSGPLGVSRYALPVVPMLLIGAAIGFAQDKLYIRRD